MIGEKSVGSREHWEGVYERKRPDEVSWYRPHLEQSLGFIDSAGLAPDAAIVDVGGGASTLVDDLLARGYTNVTAIDISARAIESAKARLGDRARQVRWLVADVAEADLGSAVYDLWHDRAVFHFLRDDERRRYVAALRRAIKPGGQVLIATFGPEGPERCSGLEVVRYSAHELLAQLGAGFELVASATEVHRTPWGADQQFVYCHCRLAR
jgi:SAM-dependent methyltransferase